MLKLVPSQERDINSKRRGNALVRKQSIYHAHLGLPDKGLAIKGLVVFRANGLFTAQL